MPLRPRRRDIWRIQCTSLPVDLGGQQTMAPPAPAPGHADCRATLHPTDAAPARNYLARHGLNAPHRALRRAYTASPRRDATCNPPGHRPQQDTAAHSAAGKQGPATRPPPPPTHLHHEAAADPAARPPAPSPRRVQEPRAGGASQTPVDAAHPSAHLHLARAHPQLHRSARRTWPNLHPPTRICLSTYFPSHLPHHTFALCRPERCDRDCKHAPLPAAPFRARRHPAEPRSRDPAPHAPP